MTDARDFLKDQEPAIGDPETLEAQLDQSEVRGNRMRVIHLLRHSLDRARHCDQYSRICDLTLLICD